MLPLDCPFDAGLRPTQEASSGAWAVVPTQSVLREGGGLHASGCATVLPLDCPFDTGLRPTQEASSDALAVAPTHSVLRKGVLSAANGIGADLGGSGREQPGERTCKARGPSSSRTALKLFDTGGVYCLDLQRRVEYPAKPANPLPSSMREAGSGTNCSSSTGSSSSSSSPHGLRQRMVHSPVWSP